MLCVFVLLFCFCFEMLTFALTTQHTILIILVKQKHIHNLKFQIVMLCVLSNFQNSKFSCFPIYSPPNSRSNAPAAAMLSRMCVPILAEGCQHVCEIRGVADGVRVQIPRMCSTILPEARQKALAPVYRVRRWGSRSNSKNVLDNPSQGASKSL